MPELDLNQPLPDRAHEAIRQAVVQAIADLGNTQSDSDDTLSLIDVLFDFVDSLLADNDATQTQLAALTDRVTALEASPLGGSGAG